MQSSELVRVGDTLEINSATTERETLNVVSFLSAFTVLEIHDIPKTRQETKDLVRNIIEKYYAQHRTYVSVVEGDNLTDDPRVAPRIDKTKMYVLEGRT